MTAHDRAVVDRDTKLPGLGLLLDPESYREQLEDALSTHPTSAANQVVDCKPVYVRYKPNVNCIALYEVVGTRSSFLSYGVVGAAGARTDRGFPRAMHVFRDDATEFALYRFPDDRRLRILRRLLDGEGSERLWSRLFGSKRQELGDISVELIGYKPERRFVGALHAGQSDGRPFAAIKLQNQRSFANAWRAANSFLEDRELCLARPSASYHLHGVSVTRWRRGELASDLIRSGAAATERLELCGAALARIHAQSPTGLPQRGPNATMALTQAAVDSAAWTYLDSASRLNDLTALLRQRLNELNEGSGPRLVASHGDYYAKQILLGRDTAVVLDFDRSAYSHPAFDVGTFIAHLQYDSIRGFSDCALVDVHARSLVDGYRRAGGDVSDRAVNTYTALAIASLTPHPFRFQSPNWPAHVDALIDVGMRYLDRSASARSQPKTSVPAKETMSWLSEAVDVQTAGSALTDLLGEGVEVCDATVVRRKEQRRCTIRYELRSEQEAATVLYGKCSAKSADWKTHELSLALSRELNGNSFLTLADSLGVVDKWNMVVQRAIRGTAVSEIPVETESIARVVLAVAAIHYASTTVDRQWTIENELEQLRTMMGRVVAERPWWSNRITHLLGCAEAMAADYQLEPSYLIHRDLHPGNVLLDGTRVGLIDLDLMARGPAAIDLGNFAGHLVEEWIRGERSTGEVKPALERLGSETRRRYPDAVADALGYCVWLTMLRHVYLSTLYADRRFFPSTILEYCERSIPRRAETIGLTLHKPAIRSLAI